jgi:glycosyltransferase involved in cell wall biosynthesis
MKVVPNGVDADFLGTQPDEFRNLWLKDLPSSEPFILSVGRIEPRKNTLNLIRACVGLGVPLVLIGAMNLGSDPRYLQDVRSLVERHPQSVRLIGPLARQELPNAYTAAAVHALTSYVETPGLASLEAGLNGCNLVVGACPPVEEYFGDIATVVRQDPASIRNGLEQALSSPRNGRHQAETIREKYGWDRVAELTEEAYRLALRESAAS